MMYQVGIAVGITSLIVYYYRGWFKKIAFLYNVVNNVPVETESQFIVNDTDASVTLSYSRMGKPCIIHIPYNMAKIASMAQFKVLLLRKQHDSLNITQEPGIPYMVSASQLGGYAIQITDEESGNVFTYQADQIPGYANEVFDI